MSFKKILLVSIIVLFTSKTFAANPVSGGTFKDWQVLQQLQNRVKFVLHNQNLKKDHQKILRESHPNYL